MPADQDVGCAELPRGPSCRTEMPAEKDRRYKGLSAENNLVVVVVVPHLDTAGRHVDRLVMMVLGGGERLLLEVPGVTVQRAPSRGRVVAGEDVDLSVVVHLQLPVLRVVSQLLRKYFF